MTIYQGTFPSRPIHQREARQLTLRQLKLCQMTVQLRTFGLKNLEQNETILQQTILLKR
jgi:hypothetical protein